MDPQLQEIFQFSGYEWLNLAWEVKGNYLIAYLDPSGLKWQQPTDPVTKSISYKYHTPDFVYKDKRIFSIGKPALPGIRDRRRLAEFGDDFVQFHCGKSFSDLPEIIRHSFQVDLPPENFLVPVAHCPSIFLLGHIGCNGSPRGMREQ